MLFTVKPCLNLSDTQFIVSIAVGNKEVGHITAFLRSAVCSVVERMFTFIAFSSPLDCSQPWLATLDSKSLV